MEKLPPIWRVAANILNKPSRTADKGWSSSLLLAQYCSVDQNEKMRWAGHVARTWERRGVLVGKPEGKNHLGDPGVDVRKILRWILRKRDVGVWTGSSWVRIGTGGGHL